MNSKSTFLLSNDDGYRSLGIQKLRVFLQKLGDVVMVAPRGNRSACSSSLTVHKKVKLQNIIDHYDQDKGNKRRKKI